MQHKRHEQVGACGIYCGFCPVTRLEKNRCNGCDWVNGQLRKVKKDKKGCVFWECAQSKNVTCCYLCEEFPCKTHFDSKEAIYTKQALDTWKELAKTGLIFLGKNAD